MIDNTGLLIASRVNDLTYPGKRYTVKVKGDVVNGWALTIHDHATGSVKDIGTLWVLQCACEYAVWKSQQT